MSKTQPDVLHKFCGNYLSGNKHYDSSSIYDGLLHISHLFKYQARHMRRFLSHNIILWNVDENGNLSMLSFSQL